MTPVPRVAVIGGGLAGSLASLVLRSRGARPTVFDVGLRSTGGRVGGGRDPDSGVQFIRPTDPRFANVMEMLRREGIVAEWQGRFGILGSTGGGFLSSEVIARTKVHGMIQGPASHQATDNGDFCGFTAQGLEATTYVGVPSMASVCPAILDRAGVEVRLGCRVKGAEWSADTGKWRLGLHDANQKEEEEREGREEEWDALIVCSHDPSLAARIVERLSVEGITSGGGGGSNSDDVEEGGADSNLAALAKERLSSLARALHRVRDTATLPVFTLSAYYPAGAWADAGFEPSFDACAVPGSSLLQFVARDASKPSRPPTRPVPQPPPSAGGGGIGGGGSEGQEEQQQEEGELWTAVSTVEFAQKLRASGLFAPLSPATPLPSPPEMSAAASAESASAADLLSQELTALLANARVSSPPPPPTATAQGEGSAAPPPPPDPPRPLAAFAKRWGAAFTGTVGASGSGGGGGGGGGGGEEASTKESSGGSTTTATASASASGTLDLLEDCVVLEPWRLAIAGDFVRSPTVVVAADDTADPPNGQSPPGSSPAAAVMMPLERAALSGLEAGERAASFFMSPRATPPA